MATTASRHSRLMFDVTPELRRRIKIAAAERDMTIRDYIVSILEAVVPKHAPEHVRGRLVTQDMSDRFDRIRQEFMRGRVFTDNSVDLIHEAREERARDLERIASK